ncbi:MAG TPA: ATPase [Bacteroidetes bacterium]|nr:ATPase [Bacteroidota bacterium]
MKFYNREKELALLKRIEDMAAQTAQMTVMVGRRRIGKTALLWEAYGKSDSLYFFIAKKNEALLCAEFSESLIQKLNIPVFGQIKTFKELFGFLMEVSKTRHFTLIIDEFQEFNSVNSAVFSEMQNIWDTHKEKSKLNLILCGSVYSMMTRIFENSREPLFGRATQRIHLKALDLVTLKEILNDYAPNYSKEDLLAFYLFTGGVAKYVELLVQARAFTLPAILSEVISENSLFLEEGKNVLIDEFGKDYGNYFSILSLIASGKSSRVEIESIMEMQTGGFLERLENEFGLIKKVRPILSKPNSRAVKYVIMDNFLKFWFRFIYKYRSAVELGNLDYVKEIIQRDYSTFSGSTLESYFIEKLKSENNYNHIGPYWERDNQNEIDIVAINELKKTVLIAEVKKNRDNISIPKLKQKATRLNQNFQGYKIKYLALSLNDM